MASSNQSLWPPFNLNNGHKLPAIGLGTFRIKDRDTILFVVDSALKAGYRSFDTAAVYNNERFIGEALAKCMPKYDLNREDIHVTSKLSNADHSSKKRVQEAFARTEANLGLAPDLYLIHFPGSASLKPKDVQNKMQRHSAWSAMVDLYDTGRVDSIGVSNFTIQHLEQLLKEYHSDVPVVNQVEWHPLYHDVAMLEYCNKNAIQLQGYHSLGGTGNNKILASAVLKEIADDHSASVSQVLLTWSLQTGVAVIPKSTNSVHIAENFNLSFMLTPDEVQTIGTFAPKQQKFAWDPKFVF